MLDVQEDMDRDQLIWALMAMQMVMECVRQEVYPPDF
jgi:hypothetical protein